MPAISLEGRFIGPFHRAVLRRNSQVPSDAAAGAALRQLPPVPASRVRSARRPRPWRRCSVLRLRMLPLLPISGGFKLSHAPGLAPPRQSL